MRQRERKTREGGGSLHAGVQRLDVAGWARDRAFEALHAQMAELLDPSLCVVLTREKGHVRRDRESREVRIE